MMKLICDYFFLRRMDESGRFTMTKLVLDGFRFFSDKRYSQVRFVSFMESKCGSSEIILA